MTDRKEYKRQHAKETAAYRKAHGICCRCGKKKAHKGRVNCLDCCIKNSQRSLEYYYRKKAENGN